MGPLRLSVHTPQSCSSDISQMYDGNFHLGVASAQEFTDHVLKRLSSLGPKCNFFALGWVSIHLKS